MTHPTTPIGIGATAWEGATNADPEQPVRTDGPIIVFETQWPVAVAPRAIAAAEEHDKTRIDAESLQSHFHQ